MTDLREVIAQIIITKGKPGGVMIACRNANEVADAIISTIRESINGLQEYDPEGTESCQFGSAWMEPCFGGGWVNKTALLSALGLESDND